MSDSFHPSSAMRVGDRERAEAADRLAAHAAAGRLSVDELEARLERAQSAVFAGDLRAVEADLPRPDLAPAARRLAFRGPVAWPAVACLALAVALTALAGHPVVPLFIIAGVLWHVSPRGPAPARLARRTWA
jgi:uncharacterized protein DUF1707